MGFITPQSFAADSLEAAGTCVVKEVKEVPQGTVFFANASAKLDNKAKRILDGIIAKATKGKVVKLEITGFVSAAGTPKQYMPLSRARAVNVEKYFLSKGFKVEFVSKGVGLSASESSAAKARKVEIVALAEETVTTGGTIPKVNTMLNVPASFEAGKPVSVKVVELDPATKVDPANPVTFSISPALPEGLTFDPATGIISGTPKNKSDANVYVISASNKCGTTTARVEAVVAPAAPAGGGGFTPAPLLDRTIVIDSFSYQPNYSLLIDPLYSGDEFKIQDAIEEFNGVDDSYGPHDGIEYGSSEPYEHVISPTLSSTPSLPSPDVNSGSKRYYVSDDGAIPGQYSDVCEVGLRTGKVIFKSIGTCSIFVVITSNGVYNTATSDPITITLAISCGDLEARTRPQLGAVEDNIGVLTPGTFGPECEVKSPTTIVSWAYAGGSSYESASSSNAFTATAPEDIPYIELNQYCRPRAAGNNAFSAEPAGSVKLADWNYVWAYVHVMFDDGSSRNYDTDNFNAAATFNNCYTNSFDPNGGSPEAITSVNAFAGENLTPPTVSYGELEAPLGWTLSEGGSGEIVNPVIGRNSNATYYAKWVADAPVVYTVTAAAGTGGSATATDGDLDGTWDLVATASSGYTFTSWACTASQTTAAGTATTTVTPTANTTCTATFTAVYAVSFVTAMNPAVTTPGSVTYVPGISSPLVLPTFDPATGFEGWFPDETFTPGSNVVGNFTPTADTILYAYFLS